jgi:hypothetical protein
MAATKIPALLKHMTVAIFKKGGIDGSTEKDQFISAWNIARFRLVQYGFLAEGSQEGEVSKMRLTGKGLKREAEHRRESDRGQKEVLFDKMFAALEPGEELSKKK